MENFWDFSVWGTFNLAAVLLLSLLVANFLCKTIPFFRDSLIPSSVLGGCILIVIAGIYKLITGNLMFDTAFFGGNGMDKLEMLTYHCLALGFIASTFKPSSGKLTKKADDRDIQHRRYNGRNLSASGRVRPRDIHNRSIFRERFLCRCRCAAAVRLRSGHRTGDELRRHI